MAAETGVDDELFAMVWFGEFEEEDALSNERQIREAAKVRTRKTAYR